MRFLYERSFRVFFDSNKLFIYFPATIKPRHKSHMIFQFTESQEMNNIVSQATLNLFLHSRKYLRSLTDSQIPKNLRCVDIEIARILQGSQHKLIFETFRNISVPDDGNDGDYVQLNVTDLVAEWFSSQETSHSLSVKIIECKSGTTMPHKIVGLDVESFATVSNVFICQLGTIVYLRGHLSDNFSVLKVEHLS